MSIVGDSVITCDEITNASETTPESFNDKKATYKIDYCILHTFLVVTTLLLIIVTICSY